ncbi:MAG: GIY-YIG nuclease family protein [Candidatus Spechtbacterales bacterium]
MNNWNVYILLCDQKTYYIGLTDDMDKRLEEHKKGYSPYTKRFSDFELVYKEDYSKRYQAEKREQQLKKWSIAKKKALIDGNIELLRKLSKGT